MLHSQEDGEDALQQTFASAFRALPGTDEHVRLKSWLYTIARNRCLSMLRARHEDASDAIEISSGAELSDEVEQREELQHLLSDLEDLPEEQRSALVLSEVGGLGHPEIARVLECETKKVKALVYQARSALIADRRARETPCEEIRELLATATPAELRRSHVRRHLRICSGCSEFRDEVHHQRGMLALALPVIPSLGLKESALAAAGIGGGGAAGGGGLLAALGAHGAAKVAAVAIATGGAAGGAAAIDPSLVDKAQAAVGRAVAEVRNVAAGSAAGGDGASGKRVAGGSLDWDSAQDAAEKKTRADKKAGRGAFAPAKPPRDSGKQPGSQRGQENPGQGNAYGRGNQGPASKARGQSKGAGPGRGKSSGAYPRGRSPESRERGLGARLGGAGGAGSGTLPGPRGGVPKSDRLLNRGRDRGRGLGRELRRKGSGH
jgi:RNA polymerase sigma factor (sigma-70 family)